MCRNGKYTERGITGLDGYGSTLWTVPAAYAVGVGSSTGVLVEPASVVVKAWERLDRLASFEFDSVLVTGAGPIGLLAALIGVQRGLDVHVFDLAADGPKPALVESLGATYHRELPDHQVVIEATGAPSLVARLLGRELVCLTGVPSTEVVPVDLGQANRDLVLRNGIVFGTVNANVRHYREAAAVLDRADDAWLSSMITRRVPLAEFAEAFETRPGDVKVVLELQSGGQVSGLGWRLRGSRPNGELGRSSSGAFGIGSVTGVAAVIVIGSPWCLVLRSVPSTIW